MVFLQGHVDQNTHLAAYSGPSWAQVRMHGAPRMARVEADRCAVEPSDREDIGAAGAAELARGERRIDGGLTDAESFGRRTSWRGRCVASTPLLEGLSTVGFRRSCRFHVSGRVTARLLLTFSIAAGNSGSSALLV